jgi:hypothetical protein
MADHKIAKPSIFVSHATSDREFSTALKQELEKVFANGVAVFSTSSPGTISVGSDWLAEVEEKLGATQAVIALITPVSVERPWPWFELGATWLRSRQHSVRIYPVCVPEVSLSDLPAPLDRLQALSLGNAADVKLLFHQLIEQFGFGAKAAVRPQNIIKRIPKYTAVKILEVDINERALYSRIYTGYGDDELMEVLDAELFTPEMDATRFEAGVLRGREELIQRGKLLHYRKIDRQLKLPPGTARRLLKEVAKRHRLKPEYENVNTVRFGYDLTV